MVLGLCRTLDAANSGADSKQVSVAVVGSGIGGSAASHFLREALDKDFQPNIVVFEGADAPGGRTNVSNRRALPLSLLSITLLLNKRNYCSRWDARQKCVLVVVVLRSFGLQIADFHSYTPIRVRVPYLCPEVYG